MARVPLIEHSDDARTQALAERLRQGRRGSLLGIYKALLHSPKLAESWFGHLNAVRWETGLSGRLREILIIRIGWRLDCAYIMRQHIPRLAEPEGLTAEDCAALQTEAAGGTFDEAERAAIRVADALTLDARVPDEIFAPLKRFFDDANIVEIMVLVGTYNMHARFVSGLEIDLEATP